MFSSIGNLFARSGRWVWRHRWATVLVILAAAISGGVVYALTGGSDETTAVAPAPQVVISEVPIDGDEPSTADLGFPAFATKNTTRVAGADPAATAAGVALAVHPSTGDAPGPDAVTLVDAGDWQGAVAAAALVASPVGAPILVTDSGEIPGLTQSALDELNPRGSGATAGRQAFVVGAAAEPADLETLTVEGDDPARVAAEIDKLRTRLADDPEHIVVATSEAPGYAVPAAAWAARSGDPVLFVGKDSVPEATVDALRRHDGVPVFVLGPESAISEQTMKQLSRIAPSARRVGDEGMVENAIAFARLADGSFGWNINDPGHGFVIANTDRPLDAAVSAPLSASGTWGPLLVTDDESALPEPLRTYLLDLKPGYVDDPTRALYNHIWLIGDTASLSVDLQAEVDELAEVTQVTSGSGNDSDAGTTLGPPPGTPESQPDDEPDSNRNR